MAARARTLGARGALWLWRALEEAVEDRIHRDAAQVAFFALLSIVPLAMLVVGGLGLVAEDDEVRRHVVTALFDAVPLTGPGDRERLEASVLDALRRAGGLGPVAVVVLVVSSSGVMGALRHTINVAWDIEERPPLLKRKAIDLLLVAGGLVVLGLGAALDAVLPLLGLVLVAVVLAVLYRVLPFRRPDTRQVVGGAVVAALGILAAREALELYFAHLTDLGALYGSLGALMGLLLFVYAAALCVLFGAELASEAARLGDDTRVARRLDALLERLPEPLRRWRTARPAPARRGPAPPASRSPAAPAAASGGRSATRGRRASGRSPAP